MAVWGGLENSWEEKWKGQRREGKIYPSICKILNNNSEESWGPKNWCFWTVVLEKTLVSPLDCKEIQPVHPKGDQSWVFIERTYAEAETPILWPPHVKSWLLGKDWCWEGLGAGGEGDNRGWDGWIVSPTRWTWLWVNSGSWRWTERPGVLRFMGSQRVGHDWATELNWTERPARRDKKDFLCDQYKEIEENNRMGKTGDLFKKIRDTKGIFHAKTGTIKNRNSMDLNETQEDDAVKMLYSIRQQIWKTQQWPQDWKRSIFQSNTKKDNANVLWLECSGMFKLLHNCIHLTF